MLLAVSGLVDGIGVFCRYWCHDEKGLEENVESDLHPVGMRSNMRGGSN